MHKGNQQFHSRGNENFRNNINRIRRCNRLICTKCDCKVQHFDNFCWNDKVDYLFFRNNYPDALGTHLRRKNGNLLI